MSKSTVIMLSCLILVGGGLIIGTFKPRANRASPVRVTIRTAEERTQLLATTRKASKAKRINENEDEYAAAATPLALQPTAVAPLTEVNAPSSLSSPPSASVAARQARQQELDLNPLQPEPAEALIFGGNSNGDCALELVNTLPHAAYVKVLNQAGSVVATVYLRSDEKLQVTLTADNYTVKYASGPATEWRGNTVYFGSHTVFFQDGKYEPISTNQILTLTLFQRPANGATDGLTPISADEFAR